MFAHFLNLPEQYSIKNKFKSMKINFLFLAVVLLLGTTYNKAVYAQNPTNTITPSINAQEVEKTNNVEKLVELIGIKKLSPLMVDASLNEIKSICPTAPQQFWQNFADKLKSDDIFVKMFIDIYKTYHTDEEIRQLIAINQTPSGEETTPIDITPQMIQKVSNVVTRTQRAVAQKASEELKAAGHTCSSK